MSVIEKPIIIRYIRDNRVPVGVVVGVDGKIGWSQCNPKDLWNRQRGLQIAIERARLSDVRSNIKEKEPHEHKIHVLINTDKGEQRIPTTFKQELDRNIQIIQRRMSK
jgi:hypothetical protein